MAILAHLGGEVKPVHPWIVDPQRASLGSHDVPDLAENRRGTAVHVERRAERLADRVQEVDLLEPLGQLVREELDLAGRLESLGERGRERRRDRFGGRALGLEDLELELRAHVGDDGGDDGFVEVRAIEIVGLVHDLVCGSGIVGGHDEAEHGTERLLEVLQRLEDRFRKCSEDQPVRGTQA